MSQEPKTPLTNTVATNRDRLLISGNCVELVRNSGVVASDFGEDASPETNRLRNQVAVNLLRIWDEQGDESEQKQSLEYLKRALDEDRPKQRKLFP